MKTMATKVLPFVKTSRPSFKFPKNGTPEEVDWLGAKKQIDAAKAAGVKQFVFVSSMGGTNPDNFLNSIGRKKDGSGGDILLWKRKAERYLVESGVPYTIIHPGGLVDEDGSKRELVVGVNDEIMKDPAFASGGTRSVARADVARVCKAALGSASATNCAFDLVSKKVGDGTPTKDASTVFASSPKIQPTSPRRRTRRAMSFPTRVHEPGRTRRPSGGMAAESRGHGRSGRAVEVPHGRSSARSAKRMREGCR